MPDYGSTIMPFNAFTKIYARGKKQLMPRIWDLTNRRMHKQETNVSDIITGAVYKGLTCENNFNNTRVKGECIP